MRMPSVDRGICSFDTRMVVFREVLEHPEGGTLLKEGGH